MKDYINIGPVPCARSASIVLCSVMSQAKKLGFFFTKKQLSSTLSNCAKTGLISGLDGPPTRRYRSRAVEFR